jgi:hypothetical protein
MFAARHEIAWRHFEATDLMFIRIQGVITPFNMLRFMPSQVLQPTGLR